MPTYDYECPACSHRFEHFSRLHDTAPRPCPRCGKKKAKRIISAGAGFIFKGSGFYVNDSRKSSGGNGNPATSESKSGAKADSKAALKGSEAHPSGRALKGGEASPSGRALKGGEASPSGAAATAPAEAKPKKKAE